MAQVVVRRAVTSPEMAGAFALRIEVFVGEQGVPEEMELVIGDARVDEPPPHTSPGIPCARRAAGLTG